METIDSFKVNHLLLLPGIYISRVDMVDNKSIYTYDIRLLKPNVEPVMDTSVMHTIEHLGATYLRTVQEDVNCIYFGPMGCRTGFYFISSDSLDYLQRRKLVENMFQWIVDYDEENKIPGASPEECGNYLDLNLSMAKYYAKMFLDRMKKITIKNYVYPEFDN